MKPWQGTSAAVAVVSDPGLDDILALALLDRLLPEADKALTPTFGNMPGDVTTRNARDFMRVTPATNWHLRPGSLLPPMPECQWIDGAQGANGLWDIRPDYLRTAAAPDVFRATPRRIISLGPLAEVLPLLAQGGVEELLVMGGIFSRFAENGNPAELNIRLDARAAQQTFAYADRVRTSVVPADVAFDVRWPRTMVEAIPELRAMDRWLKQLLRAGYKSGRYQGGNELYDPLAVFLAFYPEYARWRRSGIAVATAGPAKGQTSLSGACPPCSIACAVKDPQRVAALLFRAIFFGELP